MKPPPPRDIIHAQQESLMCAVINENGGNFWFSLNHFAFSIPIFFSFFLFFNSIHFPFSFVTCLYLFIRVISYEKKMMKVYDALVVPFSFLFHSVCFCLLVFNFSSFFLSFFYVQRKRFAEKRSPTGMACFARPYLPTLGYLRPQ